MAIDRYSEETLHRHPDSTDGTRPENGMQSRREYDILAQEEPAGNPAAAGIQVRGHGNGATRGADDQGQRATEM